MEWINIKDKPLPTDGTSVLVYLAGTMCNSRMQVARCRIVNGSNGKKVPMITVASCFGWDAPEILAWTTLPDNPPEDFFKGNNK